MPTMAAPLSPVAGGCWIYKIVLSVALTVLVLLVFAALVVIIRWRLRKSRINRRCQKASGMITIGRARDRRNPVGEIKVTSGMLNNNNRPTLNAIHETNSCPVVIPTINVIANDDKTESMTSQDMTYAHIRRSKARGQSRLASPLSRASKPSGEYADLIDTLDQESISSKPKPSPALGASTPVGLGNPGKRNPNTEETYISPVQYRVPNLVDSAEVFDNDRGFRNRLEYLQHSRPWVRVFPSSLLQILLVSRHREMTQCIFRFMTGQA
uniref:uncharacterized protein LOC100186634 isoform X2 n=1 Tax=Ciona intestinalis TaxID=7719 RepID=UPI000EF4C1ED|nr:uncharacterized protein LOC100186634 isoform X2 [Ciona intestinalis]|eukprot:XP_026694475.1 uncharacterized protein LOC100186634 isoform X2 [Ciona intestinalis]